MYSISSFAIEWMDGTLNSSGDGDKEVYFPPYNSEGGHKGLHLLYFII
jgi:hypothetical protein